MASEMGEVGCRGWFEMNWIQVSDLPHPAALK